MSDSPCGFARDQFLHCLKEYGPELSAHEVAHLAKVSVRQVLCCYHHHSWDIEAIAGEKGWLYRKRIVLDVKRTALREVRDYDDSGISKKSSNMPLGAYVGESYQKTDHGY